jgi:ribosome-associated toxin RatA of RatAB toxin-antitoxin module
VRLLALVCGLVLLSSVRADEVRVEARREGEAVVVSARAALPADPALVWEVLTAYERYPEFVPDLKSSRVLARAGSTAIVEQRGVAGFFLYRFPLEVRLAVSEQPYQRVSCYAISGNFKEMSGLYELALEGDVVQLTYSGRLVPAFRLPPLIGLPALRASVERQFRALTREILRRSAMAREPAQ